MPVLPCTSALPTTMQISECNCLKLTRFFGSIFNMTDYETKIQRNTIIHVKFQIMLVKRRDKQSTKSTNWTVYHIKMSLLFH